MTLQNRGIVVGAALMTPPRHLLITRLPESAAAVLADYLCAERAPVPGVLGPKECARVFAEMAQQYRQIVESKDGRANLLMRMCNGGRLKPWLFTNASSDDEPVLVKWVGEFCRDANIEDEAAYMQSEIPTSIKNERVYVWVDGEVVSMADVRRETAHGIAVSLVYTPPPRRNHGYASSCVAELTQRMLNLGKRFCCLFTDLANPTSNNIYQRIGYREICDYENWIFE